MKESPATAGLSAAAPRPVSDVGCAAGFGSAAFGRRFRVYSLATMVMVLASGAWTATYAPATNLTTPGVGLWERIDTDLFMLWIGVLATALLRAPRAFAGAFDAAMSREAEAASHSA